MEEIRNRTDIEDLAFRIASSSALSDFPPNVMIEVSLSAADYHNLIVDILPSHEVNYNREWIGMDEFTYMSIAGIKFKIKRNGK